MLINHFCGLHPKRDNPGEDAIDLPIVLVQAPPSPEESRLYNAILEYMHAPYRPQDKADNKQFQIMKIFPQIGVKMLIIDEIHHVLAGTQQKQRNFLNVMKFLGNELQIPIVAVGTRDAFQAIQSDLQLANRFEPALLPLWKLDDDYRRLLASFERGLPLKNVSNLAGMKLAQRIYGLTGGHIGEIFRLVARAAVDSIREGTECITSATLDKVDWIPPIKRKRLSV